MAGINKFKIVSQALSAVDWTAVNCSISEARRVEVKNPDVANDLLVSTDKMIFDTVAAGDTLLIQLNSEATFGFGYGEFVCYVKGAGVAPIIKYAA